MSTLRTTNLQSPNASSVGFTLNPDGTVTGNKASRGVVSGVGTVSGQITLDFAQANNFSLTLGGTSNLAAPVNQVDGQNGVIYISQDGVGSRTCSYSGVWDFPGGNTPVLSTASGTVDTLAYSVRSSGTSITCVFNAAFS